MQLKIPKKQRMRRTRRSPASFVLQFERDQNCFIVEVSNSGNGGHGASFDPLIHPSCM